MNICVLTCDIEIENRTLDSRGKLIHLLRHSDFMFLLSHDKIHDHRHSTLTHYTKTTHTFDYTMSTTNKLWVMALEYALNWNSAIEEKTIEQRVSFRWSVITRSRLSVLRSPNYKSTQWIRASNKWLFSPSVKLHLLLFAVFFVCVWLITANHRGTDGKKQTIEKFVIRTEHGSRQMSELLIFFFFLISQQFSLNQNQTLPLLFNSVIFSAFLIHSLFVANCNRWHK